MLRDQVSRQLFYRCGGLQAIRWLHRKGVTVLMYHKFPKEQAALERQCAYLRRRYQIISLARLSQLLRNRDPLPESAVVITIDDGHNSTYRHAHPVFTKYDIPVTMYLTTGPIDERGWLWFDRVAYAFLSSRREEVEIYSWGLAKGGLSETVHESQALGGEKERLALAERYMELMKTVPHRCFPVYLSQLEQSLDVQVPDEPPQEWATLNWDEVRLMARGNVEYGSHSVNHPILTQLEEPQEICREIVESKSRIEAELGKPVVSFSYPNGQPQDISPSITKMIGDAGYETSVTTMRGQVFRGDDPLMLRRIACDPEMPFNLFQKHVTAFRT